MVHADGAHTDHLSSGDEVGGYQVLESVGQGGMGVVYAAVHPVIGKRAAIKVMRKHLVSGDEAVKRFVTEARSLSKIDHPNIVDVYAFGTLDDGRCYFVMEWLEGETLLARRRRGGFSVVDIAAIGGAIASALAAAHEAGIVHRDLKPANIMLSTGEDGGIRVKLLDFGIAKMLEDEEDDGAQTSSGIIMGTPAYVSPEQARGKLDPRIDVYALGAILYEMMVGRPPFVADSNAELIAEILTATVTPPADLDVLVPARLEELVLGMLSKDPADRPSLADVMVVLRSLEGDPDPETERVRGVMKRERSSLTVWVVCTGIIAASIVILWMVQKRRTTAEPRAVAAVADAGTVAPTPVPPAEPQAMLVVDIGTDEARVVLDGRVVATAAGRVTIPIADAGTHALRVTTSDGRVFAREVTVAAGARVEIIAALPAVKPEATTPTSPTAVHRKTPERPRSKRKPARPKASPKLDDGTIAPSLGGGGR